MAEVKGFDDEKARQKWIEYDIDTEVLVEYVPKPRLKEELRKSEKAARLSGGQAQAADILNLKIARLAVKGWRKTGQPEHPGLLRNGEPLPFTPENLLWLMENSYGFSNFVSENATNAGEFAEEAEAKEETKKD